MATLKPTAEQQLVLKKAATGAPLKIKACAGAGKTSTLKMLADQRPNQRGRFLAFNRAIAESAKARFPRNVACSTWHSLAYRQVDTWLVDKMNHPKERPQDRASRYGLGAMRIPSVMGKPVQFSPYQLGAAIADGTSRFCNSAQSEPDARHIVVSELIDEKTAEEFRAFLLPYVKRHWEECLSREGHTAIDPDVILKRWQLSDPRIAADYICLDEAQDSNGIQLAILREQTHAQLIAVGDEHQQVYEFRGAINAMKFIRGEEARLTESFRFGRQFARLATRVLSLLGESVPVRCQPTIESELFEDVDARPEVDAILCRKNATVMGELAAGLEKGQRVAVRANVNEILAFAEGADQLIRGQRAWRPISLALFENWREVQDYSRTFAGRDLFPIVGIIDNHGTAYLRSLLSRIEPDESKADVMVASIHGSKGLEWNRVRLGGDFRFRQDDDGTMTLTPEEARLFYVGLTRARTVMDVADLKHDLGRVFHDHAARLAKAK
jgi:superfamily I DNA/RNA helicase